MEISRSAAAFAVGLLFACAGGEKQSTQSSEPTLATPASSSTAAVPVAPQPVTGKIWQVKMLGDAKGYRFDPASLTIKAGDGVQWIVVSGPPHNVTFWADSIPAGASAVLQSAMQQTTAPLTSPLLMAPNQTYTISFAGAPTGTYHYYCTPHLALGMIGKLVVQ